MSPNRVGQIPRQSPDAPTVGFNDIRILCANSILWVFPVNSVEDWHGSCSERPVAIRCDNMKRNVLMRKVLLVATILTTGALPLISAQAAPRFNVGSAMAANGAGLLTVREAKEAPRREDRRADRRQDRHSSNAAPHQFGATGVMSAREASEAPRGKDGPHDRNRNGNHSSNTTPSGFDASGIMLVREAGERARGEGKGHP